MSLVFIPSDGFGNIMFQHHAAYAFAKENGLELCALGWYFDIRPKFGDYPKLFSHVKMLGSKSDSEHPPPEYFRDPQRARILNLMKYTSERNVYIDPQHPYTPIPKEARILSGYFQSWRYFDQFRIEIRDLLRSNESELFNRMKDKYSKPNTVCIHIRWGGDGNLRTTIHPVTPIEYYEDAVKTFPDHHFIVFCEDLNLVKDLPIWKDLDMEFASETDPLSTFFAMSVCEHFIIAHSSFSLSAYYMRTNDDARLVHPSFWFGPDGPKFKMEDLLKTLNIPECI
jgi:hypothetical protein